MLDFKMAKETNLSEFLSIEKECECGQKHTLSTKEAYVYDGAIEKVANAVESLSCSGKIGLVTCENLGSISIEIAEKFGQKRSIDYLVLPTKWNMTAESIDLLPKLEEDCRIILSIGGGKATSIGKIIAKERNLPLVSVITSLSFDTMLCNYVETTKNYVITTLAAKSPDVVIVDSDIIKDNDKNLIASSFGVVASELIAEFDSFVTDKFLSSKTCPYLMDMISHSISGAMVAFNKIIDKKGGGYLELADNVLRISAAKTLIGKALPSGVEQTVLAKNLQNRKENKNSGLYGEEAFNAFIKIAKVYKLFYNAKLAGDELLPDMDKRADMLIEKFGATEEAAQNLTNNMISPKSYLAIKQALNENRRYFIDGIEEINDGLDYFINIYRTLLGDEKEGEFDKDIKVAMSLSPEIYNKFTTLTIMKFMGLLENIQ